MQRDEQDEGLEIRNVKGQITCKTRLGRKSMSNVGVSPTHTAYHLFWRYQVDSTRDITQRHVMPRIAYLLICLTPAILTMPPPPPPAQGESSKAAPKIDEDTRRQKILVLGWRK